MPSPVESLHPQLHPVGFLLNPARMFPHFKALFCDALELFYIWYTTKETLPGGNPCLVQASKISKKKKAWNDERYCEARRSVWTHVELWAFLLCTRWSWVIVTRGKLDKSVCLRGGGYILLEAVSKYSFRISRTNFAFIVYQHFHHHHNHHHHDSYDGSKLGWLGKIENRYDWVWLQQAAVSYTFINIIIIVIFNITSLDWISDHDDHDHHYDHDLRTGWYSEDGPLRLPAE